MLRPDNNSYARQSGDHRWAPKGTFMLGEIAWKIFRDLAVNRDILDQLSPNNPVILETFTAHAWIVNNSTMARMGIRVFSQE